MTEQSAPLIGTIDPLQGSALEQEPGALFYQYYRRCVRSMVRALFENGHIDSFSIVVLGAPLSQRVQGWAWSSCSDHRLRLAPGDDVVGARCRRYQSDLARNAWVLTNWAEIEPELRRAILERFALYLVGPESVLRSRRYFGARNAFNRELPTYASLIDFLDTSLLDAGGGRMSLMDVYANIAILLRLGPAIRS